MAPPKDTRWTKNGSGLVSPPIDMHPRGARPSASRMPLMPMVSAVPAPLQWNRPSFSNGRREFRVDGSAVVASWSDARKIVARSDRPAATA